MNSLSLSCDEVGLSFNRSPLSFETAAEIRFQVAYVLLLSKQQTTLGWQAFVKSLC